ncbi:MAG TPA: ABC transporter permease [Gemmatimonadaceae bacterium]|nr:ABC transporter permease [Gemmatimonadaceae bacterium]
MRFLATLWRRLRVALGRRRFEHDLDDELRFHLEMQARQLEARGVPRADAWAQARRTFGSTARYKDEVRDARGLTGADDVLRDFRLGARSLARTPLFTALALLTFALGIGANTAVFSVVNAILLRPLPFPEADRLVRVYEAMKSTPEQGWSVSRPNLEDWRAQSRSFEQLAAYQSAGAVLGGDDAAERLSAALVTPNLFATLGVRPQLGRGFTDDEAQPGHGEVAVLGDGLWRRRFGADPSIVGRTIRLDGGSYRVIGVAPAELRFPIGSPRPADVFVPLTVPTAVPPSARGQHSLSVIGRLAPGAIAADANTELRAIAARLEQAYPDFQANRTTFVQPLRESVAGRVRPALLVLLGAVGLVLLISCANVANLLVARAVARRKDVAVRLALGATRGQLVRQYLAESALIALGGALLGATAAHWGVRVLAAMSDRALPMLGPIALDLRVLAFLLAVTVLCAIVFGVAPALQVRGGHVRGAMAGAGRSTASGQQQRVRSALVVGQIALSLVLLVGAGLLMRGFLLLQRNETGVQAERVLTAHLEVPGSLVGPGLPGQTMLPLLERIRAVPGVREAGLTSLLPMDAAGTNGNYWVDRRPWPPQGSEPLAEMRVVTPGYFAALGIPVLAGRSFTVADDSLQPLRVVINQALAKHAFPGEDPVGRHVLFGTAQQSTAFEIVGVVGDVRQYGLDQPAQEEMYFSGADARQRWGLVSPTLVVKGDLPESALIPAVRAAVQEVAPEIPLYDIRSMQAVIDRSVAARRLNLWLLAIFAGVAVVLTASGLYGVIAYLVEQRTREIGIRMALGAERARVMRLVLGRGMALAGAGVVLGIAGALALSRVLASLVYGVSTRDPLVFGTVPVLVAIIALAACLVPAWRGSRVDPIVVLRAE